MRNFRSHQIGGSNHPLRFFFKFCKTREKAKSNPTSRQQEERLLDPSNYSPVPKPQTSAPNDVSPTPHFIPDPRAPSHLPPITPAQSPPSAGVSTFPPENRLMVIWAFLKAKGTRSPGLPPTCFPPDPGLTNLHSTTSFFKRSIGGGRRGSASFFSTSSVFGWFPPGFFFSEGPSW